MRKLAFSLLVLILASCSNSSAVPQPTAITRANTPIIAITIPMPALADSITTPIIATPAGAMATVPGLGLSRTKLEFLFRSSPSGVNFTDDPNATDGQAALGTSEAKGITVHLLGNPDDVQEVQVKADFDQGAESGEVMLHLLTLMKGLAPTIKSPSVWLRQHLQQAQKQSPDITIEGRYMITITTTENPQTILVSVRPARM